MVHTTPPHIIINKEWTTALLIISSLNLSLKNIINLVQINKEYKGNRFNSMNQRLLLGRHIIIVGNNTNTNNFKFLNKFGSLSSLLFNHDFKSFLIHKYIINNIILTTILKKNTLKKLVYFSEFHAVIKLSISPSLYITIILINKKIEKKNFLKKFFFA